MGEHRSADVGECVSLDELEALLKRRGDLAALAPLDGERCAARREFVCR